MKTHMFFLAGSLLGMAIMLSCGSGNQIESDASQASPLEPFTLKTLGNGLDVIVKEVRSAPIVAVYLWCGTGSMNEAAREHGISHFYEHMFFKGTEKRGVGEIDRAIKSLGGYNNAFTSKEYTAYYVVLPSENFSLAADVLVDAIRHSLFPAEEIERELGVIKEEISRKEDNPTGTLYEEMFAAMFPDTPYAHPVLGTRETVSGLTREDFQAYLDKYYVPNNMTAVVVGDIDAADAISEFERLTADWQPDPDVDSRKPVFEVPRLTGVREFSIEKDVNISYVMMAFQTEGFLNPRENATLDVVTSILGEGRSSRLYKRVIEEEQIAAAVEAFIYPLTRTGLFVVMGAMERENVPRFREVIMEELANLRDGVSPDELQKVKTMLKADFQFANEINADIGQSLGHYHTLSMLDHATGYEASIDAVTLEEINRYVAETLDPASYTVGVIYQRDANGEEVPGE